MSTQIAQQVPFRNMQCPHCKHYIAQDQRCRAYTTESLPGPLWAVFNGTTDDPCLRYELNPSSGFVLSAPAENNTAIGLDKPGDTQATGEVMNPQPGFPEPALKPVEETVASPTSTHPCPQCGAVLRLTSRTCRQCGARFDITITGYCPGCQKVMEAGADGKCEQCGSELEETQVLSQLIVGDEIQQSQAASTGSVPALARGEAKIHCPKCKAENVPHTERCKNCDAKLLPGEGIGQKLSYFIGGILGAAVLGYLLYFFYIQNPGSAPDIVLCNPGALGLGAILVLLTGFVQAVRRTPAYVRYENRARRHISLNPWQALSDLNQAIDLSPEKEKGKLIRQRANLYEKMGLTEQADRDHLLLATSAEAFKGEGEWVSAITGADADVYSHSRRSDQINILLNSGKARAVGYCSQCKNVIELDANQRCHVHPKVKGSTVEYVISVDLLAGKLVVLQKLESTHPQLSDQLTGLLDSGEAKAVGYCRRCKAAVVLDSNRRCTIHPNCKGRRVQYVLPGEIEAAQQVVLRGIRADRPVKRRKTILAIGFFTIGILFLFKVYSAQVSEFVVNLIHLLP